MTATPAGSVALAVLAVTVEDAPLAARLAAELALPLVPTGLEPGACHDFDALLAVSGGELALQQTPRLLSGSAPGRPRGSRAPSVAVLPGPVRVDFGSGGMRYRRRAGHNELLGKAVGVSGRRRLQVLDATAGLGRDSFVLADMGCAVTLCEREPVLAAMLRFGLQAALASSDDWLAEVARRMSLCTGDARALAPRCLDATDVIYLDPMFPPREKSAAVKKEMALFHSLLGAETRREDAGELLQWAVAQDVARVVVKRPARAPFLAQRKPSHSLTGRAVRFDVYVRRALG